MNGQVNISPESHAYAGNLMHNLDVWRKITSDPWVLETVSGYHLEFDTLPVQSVLPRPPPFSEREKQLIDEEITKLLTKGAIRKVSKVLAASSFLFAGAVMGRDTIAGWTNIIPTNA